MEEKIVPDFDIPINRLGTDAEKFDSRKRIFGNESVQPLWVADMDLPSPPFLQEALIDRIKHPCFGYTEQSNSLKNAVQWWMQHEHDLIVDHDNILFSPSVVTSFNNAIAAFTKYGDGIALFSPIYGPFYFAIKNHNRTLVDTPLLLNEGQYLINFDTFEKECIAGNIRLLLFCNPQNPSGRVWKKQELERLAAICKKHNVIIVSDEIHSDIIYPENKHTSILSIKDAISNSIVAHSIGKTFNTSGLNASFVLIHNNDMRVQFRQIAERSHTSDINLLGKTAMEVLFSPRGQIYKNALISYLAANQEIILTQLQKISGIEPMVAESTFLSWINFNGTGLNHTEIMNKLVNDAGLGLGGGLFYGPIGKGWFRLNFAVTKSKLKEALDKMSLLQNYLRYHCQSSQIV